MNPTFPPSLFAVLAAAKSKRGRTKLPSVLYNHGLQCLGIAPEHASGTPTLLTPQNLADLLQVSRTSVNNWTLTGKLVPTHADEKSGKMLFSLAEVFAAARDAISTRPRVSLALLTKATPAPNHTAKASRRSISETITRK